MRATFGTLPPTRQPTAFTLVELLVTIGIIMGLTSVLLPTMRSAREQALRVECASNLRQIGFVETRYACENGGWLFLRGSGNPGTVRDFTPPGDGCLSLLMPKYTNGNVWFCPGARNRYTGDLLTETDRAALFAGNHTGYAFYGACWSRGGAISSTQPMWGPIGTRIRADARKMGQLRADIVRASEYWEPTVPFGGTGGSMAGLPNHHDRRGNLAGGNMLMGDGSVQWSTYGYKYYAGDLYIYVMPEELRTAP